MYNKCCGKEPQHEMTTTFMIRHSSGPWKAIDQGEGPRGKSLGICIVGPSGLPMFFLPRGTERHMANAQLIAAAPELLEALREVIAITDRNHEVWDKAKAAIAKAEGR